MTVVPDFSHVEDGHITAEENLLTNSNQSCICMYSLKYIKYTIQAIPFWTIIWSTSSIALQSVYLNNITHTLKSFGIYVDSINFDRIEALCLASLTFILFNNLFVLCVSICTTKTAYRLLKHRLSCCQSLVFVSRALILLLMLTTYLAFLIQVLLAVSTTIACVLS